MLTRQSDPSLWGSECSPTRLHCLTSSLGQVSTPSHWTFAADFPRAFTPCFDPLQHSLHTSAKDICVRCRVNHHTPLFSAHPFLSIYLMPKQGCCGKDHSPQHCTQQCHQGPGSSSSFQLANPSVSATPPLMKMCKMAIVSSHTQISNNRKEENVLFVFPWGPGSHSNFETSFLGERVHWLFKINHKSSLGTDCQLISEVMQVLRARKNEIVDASRQNSLH